MIVSLQRSEVVPEQKFGEGTIHDEDRAAILFDRLDGYSTLDQEAAHLRPHQVEATEAFRQTSLDIITGTIPESGMGIIHPTGSGKSVIGAELFRMICVGPDRPGEQHLPAIWLTPRHTIGRQILGHERGIGVVQEYVPSATVGEYSGYRTELGCDMTVMTYQSLLKAEKQGDIDEIDPALIICDEVHHVIDGAWARAVKAISAGRLLVGLTATPDYSDRKNIGSLFKHELVRKTMRQGVEEGILSPLEGHIYKGSSVIVVKNLVGGDFSDEDLFNAIADSEDNLLAAKLCAQEVEANHKGIVACVPGHDRAHAKVMAEILNRIEVTVEGQRRTLKAAYVGGELPRHELESTLERYKQGELDVLTQVDLLTEGWDSPETDFLVSMRPTTSKVLAAQRLGRILRARKDKIASVHELSYDIYGTGLVQVMFNDVLDGHTKVVQPFVANKSYLHKPSITSFATHNLKLNPAIPAKVTKMEARSAGNTEVHAKKDIIPFDWLTLGNLARKLYMPEQEVAGAINTLELTGRDLQKGPESIRFYAPDTLITLTNHFGIPSLPQDTVTLAELTSLHKDFADNPGLVTPRATKQALLEKKIAPGVYVAPDGVVVQAYPATVKHIAIDFYNPRDGVKSSNVEIESTRAQAQTTPHELFAWLDSILVNPHDNSGSLKPHIVIAAQKQLVASLKSHSDIPVVSVKRADEKLRQLDISPTEQMKRVMASKDLTLAQLLSASELAMKVLRRSGIL